MRDSVLSKYHFFSIWSVDLMQSQSKLQQVIFLDSGKLILKFIWRNKRPRIAKSTLRENKVGRLSLPDFKTYYKVKV